MFQPRHVGQPGPLRQIHAQGHRVIEAAAIKAQARIIGWAAAGVVAGQIGEHRVTHQGAHHRMIAGQRRGGGGHGIVGMHGNRAGKAWCQGHRITHQQAAVPGFEPGG